MSSPPRAALRRAALSVTSVVFVLALAELALRVVGSAPLRYRSPRSLENALKTRAVDAYPSNPHGTLDLDLRDPRTRDPLTLDGVPGLERAAQHTPYAVSFAYNPERCRNAPVGPRVPGTTRVLVLGDSFTEGQGVREGATFTRLLESALRARGRAVELVNCGRRGSDFPGLYERFTMLTERYAPDVVLYAMVLNDPVQSPEFRARQRFLNDWILDRRRMLDDGDDGQSPWWHSRLLSFARERLDALSVARATTRWYQDMYSAPNAAGWSETQSYLRRMNAAMRARGGTLTLTLLPLLVGTEGRYPFAEPSRAVARACEAARIPFDDALEAVRGLPARSLWVHPVDMHPDEQAHALFAAHLLPVLERALPPR